MRPVKNRSHAVERNPNSRAASFGDFGIQRNQKGFNVSPLDRRWHRIFEDLG
jgi:hypothetical protein